jgi:hypothetical protein
MWRCLPILGILVFTVGCVNHQVYRDQDKMREVLLDLYTNQIMENLIRAKKGLPIVQVDYDKAFAQVTLKESSSLSDAGALTTSTSLATATKTLTTFVTGVNTLVGSGTLDHTNQVSVASSPVINMDPVFDAYAEFLSYEDSLQVSCDPVPEGVAHICRRVGKEYYWVPMNYQKQFLYLALVTTAQRGGALPAMDPFYTISLTQIVKKTTLTDEKVTVQVDVTVKDPANPTKTTTVKKPQVQQKKVFQLEFKIDQALPFDTGRITIADPSTASKGQNTAQAGGKTPSQGGSPAPAAQVSSPTSGAVFDVAVASRADDKGRPLYSDRIIVTYKESIAPGFITPDALEKLFQNLPISAKIYLRRHRPQPVSPNTGLDRIDFQLQQIQLNQQRNATSP